MNKRKILKCLLSASIVGTLFSINPVKTFAEWKFENNSWKYEENSSNVTGWHKYNNNWYYFNNEGIMQTGWVKDNGSWYYLNSSGDMKTGWVQDNGTWYYLNKSGDMQTGWVQDNGTWYYLNESGSMQTGWVEDNGTWYYLNESGSMQTGWIKDNNKWYYLSQSGQMKTDWVNDNGTWYYLSKDGAMQTGVISVSGKVYYLNESGAMQTGKVVIDGQEYEFSSNGDAIGKIPAIPSDKIFGTIGNVDNINNGDIENEANSSSGGNKKGSSSKKSQWKLVWQEDFNGDKLDEEIWSCEKRDPGWVNNELQEYTDSEENVYVKDGNLVLKAIKTQRDGKDYYTSGKVSTQDKLTFKYGKFEIRAKSPKGQGLWPALWMMPNDESLYGQWPKCGEIDIMEILGHEPNKVYGTIHYGDPHEEQQNTYTLDKGSFADDYHIYGVEWEPGEIRFYVDGHMYHKVNDWFTMVEGGDEVTYPAPFDQEFYMQCNLAVGGSWPGNPDETTDFDNAEFKIDYIKAYQKDSYNEDVKKPEAEEIILRDPDANGNYVINGDFSKGDSNWEFKEALNGKGNYEVSDNKMIIKSENEGTADYSIQLLQPGIPLKEGGIYRVSFDAKAEKERSMIVDVSGPDRSYIRYLKDTKVDLTTDLETYSYEFTMEKKDDANGRLEFNLGNQGSLAEVEISNVKIEKIGQAIKDENGDKKIMPDGNYVNNGTFDVGENRMKYWEVESKTKKAKVEVTNINNSRELMVTVNDKSVGLEDVVVKQTNLALKPNKKYVLYFDAYAKENKNIEVSVNGENKKAQLTNKKKTFKYEFETGEKVNSKDIKLFLGAQGVTYIDNVRVEENVLIRNGSFDSGLIAWEVFTDGNISSAVSYGVDSLNEKNAVQLEITNTGDADWKIQLKQNNVKLEEGKKYKLSFEAKSTIDRDIMYAIQRDGSKDNNWDAYTGSNKITVGKEFKTYSLQFEMKKPTDANSIFTISMGAVNGEQITDKHTVTIDNVVLEEIDEIDFIPDDTEKGEVLVNGDFSNGLDGWSTYCGENPAKASFKAEDNKAKITVDNTGYEDWHVQLKQESISLKANTKYKLSFKAESTLDRKIKFAIQKDGNKNNGDWATYFDTREVEVTKNGNDYEVVFTMGDKGDDEAVFAISMGAVNGQITKSHMITVSDVKLVEVEQDSHILENDLEIEETENVEDIVIEDIITEETENVEDTVMEDIVTEETTDKVQENENVDADDTAVDETVVPDSEDNKEDKQEPSVEEEKETEPVEENKSEIIVDKIDDEVIADESVEEEETK